MNNSGKRVLITGATGFLGSYLCRYLVGQQFSVIAASRNGSESGNVERFKMGDLEEKIDWQPVLKNVDAVVHLAARVHQMRESDENESLYFTANVDATLNLAQQCAQAGVRRFIFASSVKAMGEGGESILFSEKTKCQPSNAYGRSKLEAEKQLCALSDRTGLDVLALRLPLVYGPGVKGNMGSLINMVRKCSILPLGGLKNRRSFLAVHNFASAVAAVLKAEKVPGKIYLLSDIEAVSTTVLVNNLIQVFSPGTKNLNMPKILWQFTVMCPFLGARVRRLTESFEIDSSAFCNDFDWSPSYSMINQFVEMKNHEF